MTWDVEISLPLKWQEWKITKELGAGNYGAVYEAAKEEDGRTQKCAIKIIELPADESERNMLIFEMKGIQNAESYLKDQMERYTREITSMYALQDDPHIVRIEDYVTEKLTDTIGWRIYIRMELLTGFRDYTGDRALDEKEVIRLGTEICDALISCDHHRIMHRDIKPENIFVTVTGNYKLGDFGEARELDRTYGSFSEKQGTLSYMAPEVYKGKKYNKQVDIYSLGIVLYRLMNNGKEPFVDVNKQFILYNERQEAFEKRMNGEELPPPVNASPALASVILKACAANAKDRYPDAAAFKEDLNKALDPEHTKTEITKAGPVRREKARKRRKLLIGAAAAALVFTGGTVWYEVQVKPRIAKLITTQDVETAARELITSMASDAGEVTFEKFSGYFRNADSSKVSKYNSELAGLENYEKMYISVLTSLDGDAEKKEPMTGDYIGMDSDDYFVNIIAYTPGGIDEHDYVDARSFVFLISRMEGEWKVDLDADKMAAARERIKQMHIKPEGYEEAAAARRMVLDESGNNYMYLDSTAVFEGMLIWQLKHVWQNTDGSLGCTVWIANGSGRDVSFGKAGFTITDIYLGTIAEGELDISETVDAGTNVLKEFVIPAADVEPGKENWTDVTPTLWNVENRGLESDDEAEADAGIHGG